MTEAIQPTPASVDPEQTYRDLGYCVLDISPMDRLDNNIPDYLVEARAFDLGQPSPDNLDRRTLFVDRHVVTATMNGLFDSEQQVEDSIKSLVHKEHIDEHDIFIGTPSITHPELRSVVGLRRKARTPVGG